MFVTFTAKLPPPEYPALLPKMATDVLATILGRRTAFVEAGRCRLKKRLSALPLALSLVLTFYCDTTTKIDPLVDLWNPLEARSSSQSQRSCASSVGCRIF
jgi:hypothetical protein